MIQTAAKLVAMIVAVCSLQAATSAAAWEIEAGDFFARHFFAATNELGQTEGSERPLADASGLGARVALWPTWRFGVEGELLVLPTSIPTADISAVASSAMAADGVPIARISTLVPPLRAGGKPEIQVAYRAAGGRRPVALVQAATGNVTGGPKGQLVALKPGSKLANGDLVLTAKASVVRLALADGSFVVLAPGSHMRIRPD